MHNIRIAKIFPITKCSLTYRVDHLFGTPSVTSTSIKISQGNLVLLLHKYQGAKIKKHNFFTLQLSGLSEKFYPTPTHFAIDFYGKNQLTCKISGRNSNFLCLGFRFKVGRSWGVLKGPSILKIDFTQMAIATLKMIQ